MGLSGTANLALVESSSWWEIELICAVQSSFVDR